MKPIAEYIAHHPDGWAAHQILPEILTFINAQEGISLNADVKDYGKLQIIHVSIAPIHTIPNPPTVEQLLFRTAEILQLFFDDRGFAMQPDDARNPNMKHYFSILEEGE